MASTNVAKLAAELKMPADALLEQLRAAGVDKRSADDTLSEADQEQLLGALRRAHGADEAPKRKITLTRKQTSEIKQADATGKARTIQVEVRKKRVFVKRDVAEPVAELQPVDEQPASVLDESERAQREAEEQRQRELLERQAAELREKQERLEREAREAEQRRREDEVRREAEREAAARQAEAAPEVEADRSAEAAAAAAAAEARARAEEEAVRKAAEEAEAARRAVEAEVAEINRLMAAQRRPQPKAVPAPAPAPVPAQAPAAQAAAGPGGKPTVSSGTLHRPAGTPAKPAATDAPKKHVKSEKLSSTWSDDASKRRGLKTRGSGPESGWRGRGGRGGRDRRGQDQAASQPMVTETIVRDVH
ncbi:MAG: translation initiation factor IF-2 associated domain-containing protein, partial [Burkholderiaceae bacterium]